MSTMSSSTLVMCIQAVEAEIARLRQSVERGVDELGPDEQETLLSFAKAASELRHLLETARAAEPGLPSYDDLLSAP